MKKIYQKYSLISGSYLGGGLSFFTTICYIFDSKFILPELNTFSITFGLILIIYTIFSLRKFKLNFPDEICSFKICFSICFCILAVALLIAKIYVFFLYVYLDNSLVEEYIQYTYLKNDIATQGYSFDSWSDVVEGYFSFPKQMQSYIFTLIPCTLYSSIISLLMKQ